MEQETVTVTETETEPGVPRYPSYDYYVYKLVRYLFVYFGCLDDNFAVNVSWWLKIVLAIFINAGIFRLINAGITRYNRHLTEDLSFLHPVEKDAELSQEQFTDAELLALLDDVYDLQPKQ
ncbi:hypothetical protein KR093_010052 [Drosophila rubida]|uniref:Uncharacterized protein n=1 Tax=Drosophila rubida TaxID=30044 RepID=A0AAD4KC40_9MUSC|nr:hypothetical protein KR093_010052 [Drosophila rubida]